MQRADLSLPPSSTPIRRDAPAHPHPLHIGEVPPLDARYVTPASRARTVVICAGSSSKPGVVPYEPFTAALATAVVRAGGNLVTGGGTKGPMGAAFKAGAAAARAEGAGENLMVVKEPVWGDEDFVNASAIGKAPSESARFEHFQRVGATVVICAGGPGALLELAMAINGVVYPSPDLPPFTSIIVVGDFYEGMKRQVATYVDAGTMTAEQAAKIRFVPPSESVIAEISAGIRQAVAARDKQ